MKFSNNIIQLILPTAKFSVTPIIPAIHYLANSYIVQITNYTQEKADTKNQRLLEYAAVDKSKKKKKNGKQQMVNMQQHIQ